MRWSIVVLSLSLGTAGPVGASGASFSGLDLNRDNRISVEEAQGDAQLSRGFADADLNGDGVIDRAEFARQTWSDGTRLYRG